MKKKILVFIFLLQSAVLFAQDEERERNDAPAETSWSTMSGSMIYFYTQKLGGQKYTGINTMGVFGIRYNFKNIGKHSVLAASAVPGLGLAFYSGYNGSNLYFSFDLPLTLEIHTGVQANPESSDLPVGFFAGGGISINYLNKEFYLNTPKSGFSYGPVANAGVKLNVGRSVIILRGSYMYNLNNEIPDIKGVGILWGGR